MYVQASKTPVWHKVISVLTAVVLALGLSPIIPNAVQKAYADPAYPGYAYISLSDDGKFVVSDGEEGLFEDELWWSLDLG